MENVNGGFMSEACTVLAAGQLAYELGAATEFWNPIGWLSTGLLVADGVCVGWGLSQL